MVRIWWDGTVSLYRISSPYSESFIKSKIHSIPWQDRAWDSQTRTWLFAEQYLDDVQRWCIEEWPGMSITVKTRFETEREMRGALPSGEFTIFQKASIAFVELLDAEALASAFKKMAVKLHPDKGGDKSKFSELNSAYQELKKIIGG